jgi:hypothetical protein
MLNAGPWPAFGLSSGMPAPSPNERPARVPRVIGKALRIALIFTMATPVLWTDQQGTQLHPMLFAGFTSYPRAASGLIIQQTQALARTLESGFQSLGASL